MPLHIYCLTVIVSDINDNTRRAEHDPTPQVICPPHSHFKGLVLFQDTVLFNLYYGTFWCLTRIEGQSCSWWSVVIGKIWKMKESVLNTALLGQSNAIHTRFNVDSLNSYFKYVIIRAIGVDGRHHINANSIKFTLFNLIMQLCEVQSDFWGGMF